MFGGKSFIDLDNDAFHIQSWSWLLKHTGGLDKFVETPLVLPTPDFFPPTSLEGHDKAQFIFDQVSAHAGMSDWPVELVAQTELAGRVSGFGVVQNTGTAAGTFSNHGNSGKVTYDPGQLKDPVSLIATFAHELSHYLNGGFPEEPPGGWELIEPATDVTAAFLGFGIFGANSAFHFTRTQDYDSQGWSSSRLGYITEGEWALNIAIFAGSARSMLNRSNLI